MKKFTNVMLKSSSYATLIILLLFSSCSTKMTFLNSTVVPAAEGSVKVDKDDNGNYDLELNVTRLTEPSRLQPSKAVYVVWLVTDNNGTKNIGQLKSSTSLFSSELKASLHTVSSFKPKRIFVTAENDANLQHPGTQVVLTTKTN